ncbi:MAG: DUF1178 family protein [Deltaproteobacteria bacterium]|jgi:hypothetical protein|nr:DUF1178 family protein [Deltaproteobacteria bacterium]
MVIFDLICPEGHNFEGWFADLADLEKQLEDGLISCPVCGDTRIMRTPSTFGLVKSKTQKGPGALPEDKAQEKAQLLEQLERLTEKIKEDYQDVGSQFTTEALKMHYGATPKRNIRGLSTQDEEEILKKEGVDFLKVPMLVRKPSGM